MVELRSSLLCKIKEVLKGDDVYFNRYAFIERHINTGLRKI